LWSLQQVTPWERKILSEVGHTKMAVVQQTSHPGARQICLAATMAPSSEQLFADAQGTRVPLRLDMCVVHIQTVLDLDGCSKYRSVECRAAVVDSTEINIAIRKEKTCGA
jgi:hypothetical protein